MIQLLRRALPIVAALLALLAHPLSARSAQAADRATPALWKVSDADTTIWLFGTIHALPPGVSWMNGKVARAFSQSREVVTEIVESEPAETQALVARHAMLPADQSLRDLLPEAERTRYEAALAGLGLPAAAFDRFEPWYAAVALATIPLLADGFDESHGADAILDRRARVEGRLRGALETAEYQLSLFDSLTGDEQRRYLMEVVDSLPTMKADLGRMIAAWKTGDAEGLARLMNEGEDDPALMEKLLVGRNRAWAEWVRRRLDKPGIVFVAVGAGHLAGPGSVQDQLAAAGIPTRRVQ